MIRSFNAVLPRGYGGRLLNRCSVNDSCTDWIKSSFGA
jgi:hypothetical protein